MRASAALLFSTITFIRYLMDRYLFRHGILQVSMAGTGYLVSRMTLLITEGFSLGSTPDSMVRFLRLDPVYIYSNNKRQIKIKISVAQIM
jgi:hypothetical protein